MNLRRFSLHNSFKSLAVGLVLLACSFGALLGPQSTMAQTSRIKHVIKGKAGFAPLLGRDLWFTLCQNYDAGGQNGKVDVLYVTSQNATTVHIAILGSTSQAFPINPNQIVTFKIPLAWEVTTSGVVENKAIRIWSDNADLCAYMMSFNPYTSEGMYVLPSIGWGTQYTVAAYAGLFEDTFDYASEYATISNQNNTQVYNIPSTDIRYSGSPKTVQHAKDTPFLENLQRGQVVQYKSVQAQNCSDYDMTGTLLTSNNPIGVVGASMCPNIPCDYPYCDFVCEMDVPQRSWTDTYLTVPFAGRQTTTNTGDTFLAIGSVDGQTIYNDDPQLGPDHVFCTGLPKFQPFWFNQVSAATKFHSDQPFELLQYENSSTFPSPNNSVGDAAMTTINGVEEYTPKVVFQTPLVAGLPYTFLNFVNVICPNGNGAHVKLDGRTISGTPGSAAVNFLDKSWIGYIISNLAPGTHVITCDTVNGVPGVAGSYIYGYGSYDSYAWAGGIGNKSFNTQDTFPPLADTTGACFCAHVSVSDYVHPVDTKIASITLDTITNMAFNLDPNYLAGTLMDSSFYDICVADSTKPAYVQVTVYDYAGNQTTIQSTYQPQTAAMYPQLTNFGTGTTGQNIYNNVYIKNTGVTPFDLSTLKLKHGNLGFTLVTTPTGTIPVGDSVLVKVAFDPNVASTVQDTILAGDACVLQQAVVIGNGGAPDFVVTDDDFGCVDTGVVVQNLKVTLANPSPVPVTIDTIWTDNASFKFLNVPPLPITLPAKTLTEVALTFSGVAHSVTSHFATAGHFWDRKDNIQHTDSLIICGIAPDAQFFADDSTVLDCTDSAAFQFTLQNTSTNSVTLTSVTGSSDPVSKPWWSLPKLEDQNNIPVPFPEKLGAGSGADQKYFVALTFAAPPKASGVFYDTIRVFDNSGNEILHNGNPYCIAKVTVHYRDANVSTTSITFPTVPYGSGQITQTFQVCNTSQDTVTVLKIVTAGTDKNSFSTSPAVSNLQLGPAGSATSCTTITVTFDPKVSSVQNQNANINVQTDGCTLPPLVLATASLKYGSSTASGFNVPPIFACDQVTDTVPVFNGNLAGIFDSIISVQSNSVNFTPVINLNPHPAIDGQTSGYIPILFAPTPGGGNTTYTGVISVQIRDNQGRDTTLTATVSGSGVGLNSTITSNFGTKTQDVAGAQLTLPINLTVTKNGLTTPLTAAGITGDSIVYSFDQDQVNIPNNDLAAAGVVTGLPATWSVDPVSSKINTTTGTLTLVTKGTAPLADGVNTLGSINFQLMLTKAGNQRFNVKIDTAYFLQSNDQPVNACMAVASQGGNFGVIYNCGDSSIAAILSGSPLGGFTQPINPNPVTSAKGVMVSYAVKGMMPLSMSIYDVLGKEVAHVMQDLMHSPGNYQVNVDVSKLPSGTYTCYLNGPRVSGSQQFVISR